MPLYTIRTEQSFSVTYTVEADSPDAAWNALVDPASPAQNMDQVPGEITGTRDDASIEITPA